MWIGRELNHGADCRCPARQDFGDIAGLETPLPGPAQTPPRAAFRTRSASRCHPSQVEKSSGWVTGPLSSTENRHKTPRRFRSSPNGPAQLGPGSAQGALLSLAIELPTTTDSRTTSFRYTGAPGAGTDPALERRISEPSRLLVRFPCLAGRGAAHILVRKAMVGRGAGDAGRPRNGRAVGAGFAGSDRSAPVSRRVVLRSAVGLIAVVRGRDFHPLCAAADAMCRATLSGDRSPCFSLSCSFMVLRPAAPRTRGETESVGGSRIRSGRPRRAGASPTIVIPYERRAGRFHRRDGRHGTDPHHGFGAGSGQADRAARDVRRSPHRSRLGQSGRELTRRSHPRRVTRRRFLRLYRRVSGERARAPLNDGN